MWEWKADTPYSIAKYCSLELLRATSVMYIVAGLICYTDPQAGFSASVSALAIQPLRLGFYSVCSYHGDLSASSIIDTDTTRSTQREGSWEGPHGRWEEWSAEPWLVLEVHN